MTRIMIAFPLILLLIFAGCNNNNQSAKDEVNFTKLSTNESTDQQISNQAKDKLSEREEITNIHAVNTTELLVVAFEVSHINRFNLASLEKKIKKEFEKEFPKLDVTLSTDKKISLELSELESKIKSGSINKKKLNKKLKEIKKLSEEET